jgi:hypothetical protein
MSASYNSAVFGAAHQKYFDDPKTLDDFDIAQFEIIDPKLAERARAKRAGFVEAEDEDTRTLAAGPMTGKAFLDFYRDVIVPILATHKYTSETMRARLDALETRLLELEAQRAANVDVSDLIQ